MLDRTHLGAIANAIAGAQAFDTYRAGIAENTIQRQQHDLALFRSYLQSKINVGDLYNDPQAWSVVTWGFVQGFVLWMLERGYAIGSVNVRLATIKRYASLAHQASVIAQNELNLIRSVRSYTSTRNIDKKRVVTRIGAKKAQSVRISKTQRKALKRRINNKPQGACYALLMCLLLDHGLRVSEAISLPWDAINFEEGTITFYRSKVDRTDTHRLTPDTLEAAIAYRPFILEGEQLFRSSKRGGGLALRGGLTRGAAQQIVRRLGYEVGIDNLSPHDCRHSWATEFEKTHTPFELRDGGGWSSLLMPNRYVERRKISHDGKDLD